MATTLRKLCFETKRLLLAGTANRDAKISDAYIIEELRQVSYGLLKLEWYNGKNAGDNSVSPLCIATYSSVPVLNDTIRKRNYCIKPAYFMNVPSSDGNLGLQQVKPQTGIPAKDYAMIPIQPHEMELFRNLLVGTEIMKDQWMVEEDRDKLWFSKKNGKTLLESSISLLEVKGLVHDPSQILDTDPYPVPPELELEMIKGVLLLHGVNPASVIHDQTDNSNPNN